MRSDRYTRIKHGKHVNKPRRSGGHIWRVGFDDEECGHFRSMSF
jgi:hypothetical protein